MILSTQCCVLTLENEMMQQISCTADASQHWDLWFKLLNVYVNLFKRLPKSSILNMHYSIEIRISLLNDKDFKSLKKTEWFQCGVSPFLLLSIIQVVSSIDRKIVSCNTLSGYVLQPLCYVLLPQPFIHFILHPEHNPFICLSL